MSILENIRFAFSALWVNKIRSLLTMLGVIIGVSAVITLMSIGEGVRNEFGKSVKSIGSNLIAVLPVKINTESGGLSMGTSFVGISTLKSEDADALRDIPHIEHVGAMAILGGVTQYEGKTAPNALVAGITVDINDLLEYELKKGRLLNQEDVDQKKKVLVVSEGTVNKLFGGENPLGKKLVYFGEEMEIVGVANWTFGGEGEINFLEGDIATTVGMPITTAWEVSRSEQIHRVIIGVDDTEYVREVQEKAKEILRQEHGGVEDFSVMTAEDVLSIFDDIFGILTNAIVGIAAISLIVGGIGIMNIMLVSVTERTKEIGIRKALGASGINILFQFLVESSVLSFFGGFLGVALSYGMARIIDQYLGIPTLITYGALVLAFGVSVVVGVIFGLMPASKAARKNPIDALRYE